MVGVVINFINQAVNGDVLTVYGDGTQTRSFCYITDLIDGLVKMMKSDAIGPINLGNPEEYDIDYLAKLIIEITGSKSKIKNCYLPIDDPTRRCPDITRAFDILKWKPVVDLREGLQLMIDSFVSNSK